ncbi:hypothetical protein [Roseiarcus fermentans]|uniref:hypothetical protein n=1 Tax=Roseiarcus fermentans TaxID=1473586 RepID=UPI0014747976|nr:hypothetical protein [Roseiarcus fermentans]
MRKAGNVDQDRERIPRTIGGKVLFEQRLERRELRLSVALGAQDFDPFDVERAAFIVRAGECLPRRVEPPRDRVDVTAALDQDCRGGDLGLSGAIRSAEGAGAFRDVREQAYARLRRFAWPIRMIVASNQRLVRATGAFECVRRLPQQATRNGRPPHIDLVINERHLDDAGGHTRRLGEISPVVASSRRFGEKALRMPQGLGNIDVTQHADCGPLQREQRGEVRVDSVEGGLVEQRQRIADVALAHAKASALQRDRRAPARVLPQVRDEPRPRRITAAAQEFFQRRQRVAHVALENRVISAASNVRPEFQRDRFSLPQRYR